MVPYSYRRMPRLPRSEHESAYYDYHPMTPINPYRGFPQKFPGGLGSMSCINCRVTFSITTDKKMRPEHIDCPFCYREIF